MKSSVQTASHWSSVGLKFLENIFIWGWYLYISQHRIKLLYSWIILLYVFSYGRDTNIQDLKPGSLKLYEEFLTFHLIKKLIWA